MRSLARPVPRLALMAGLTAVALIWAVPLVWAVVGSFRPPTSPIGPGNLWFGSHFTLENYVTAFRLAPFGRYYVNSIVIVLGILSVQFVTITLAGFAFARYEFRWKNLLFFLILLQMMIPLVALLVPNYGTIRTLGIYDRLIAIMIPYFGSAFGTFILRQTFEEVPRDFDDAAVVDGAGWWQVLWHVYLPFARPALAAFALVSVTYHWNEFLWPLIVTDSVGSRPLTVGLAIFTIVGEAGAQWPLVSAATLIVSAPLLVVFLIFQKQFIRSFMQSGLK